MVVRKWIPIVTGAGALALGLALILTMPPKQHDHEPLPDEPEWFGFDLSRALIPVDEIRSGGPPKDGIPSLTNPLKVSAAAATFLHEGSRVVGVHVGGAAVAYPLDILNYHEVVNDSLGGLALLVTYCPLCDSAVAFNRKTELGELEFGVSGLLYNSNVLMYDRAQPTESLWSQMRGQAISGPAAGTRLDVLPVELTTWRAWRERFPETLVLSDQTGYAIDYRQSPYEGYFAQVQLMFPARPQSEQFSLKEPVLGVWDEDVAMAFAWSQFSDQVGQWEHTVGGKKIQLIVDHEAQSVRVVAADEGLRWMYSFWFAWYAFRPHTQVADSRAVVSTAQR